MSLLLQVLVSGLAAGAVYGLVAVALVLVYRLTGIVYFAFGDLVGLAVFAALLVAAGTGPVTQTSVGAGRFLVAVAVVTGVCIATSVPGRTGLPSTPTSSAARSSVGSRRRWRSPTPSARRSTCSSRGRATSSPIRCRSTTSATTASSPSAARRSRFALLRHRRRVSPSHSWPAGSSDVRSSAGASARSSRTSRPPG